MPPARSDGILSSEWIKTLANYGFAAVALSGVLYFVGYQMILPTQETNLNLVRDVAANNSAIAANNTAITSLVKEISDSQRLQAVVLEEFRREALANQKAILEKLPVK